MRPTFFSSCEPVPHRPRERCTGAWLDPEDTHLEEIRTNYVERVHSALFTFLDDNDFAPIHMDDFRNLEAKESIKRKATFILVTRTLPIDDHERIRRRELSLFLCGSRWKASSRAIPELGRVHIHFSKRRPL